MVVLPLPVGPAQITMPYGERMQRAVALGDVRRHAELLELEERPALVEQPHDDLLAADDRGGRDPDVDLAALDRPC